MNNFFDNLFGTIAQGQQGLTKLPSNISFIPKNNEGGIVHVKGDFARWLGMKNQLMQRYAYEFCYPVSSVVERLAEYDLTGELEIVYAKGKKKDDDAENPWANRVLARLQQPNPMQTWEQFRGQQLVYKRVFGYCPVLPIVPVGFGPEYCSTLINLPPWLFTAVPQNGTQVIPTKIEDYVKEYRCTILGSSFTLKPEQVIILEDSFWNDEQSGYLLPQSRLVGLDMAISNCCAAMEADNVLLKKKGPLGFVSHDASATKDAVAGYLPMTDEEKKEIQDDLTAYGMSWSQYQYAISKTAVKWNPMSYDVKELGTKETIIASEKAICHRFGFPYVLYEETDATYANGSNAATSVYQNVIIPNNKKDMNKYNAFFKSKEQRLTIQTDFSALEALQEDALNANRALTYQNQALQIQWLNNIITRNQWLRACGYPTLPGLDGEMYFKDTQDKVTDPAALLANDHNNPPA